MLNNEHFRLFKKQKKCETLSTNIVLNIERESNAHTEHTHTHIGI